MEPGGLGAEALRAGRLAAFGDYREVEPEVTYGRSRLDFRLQAPGLPPCLVEVKSVTLVVDGLGCFPDAVTERGRRHVAELSQMARANESKAMVLFVVPREDARVVRPYPAIDPEFAAALSSARKAGVMLRAARFRVDAGGAATYLGPLPVRTAC